MVIGAGIFSIWHWGDRGKRGQMKIMQMAFMIVAVFIFFIMVGLFLFMTFLSGMHSDAENMERQDVISSMAVLSGMNEFAYSSGGGILLDEDKLRILSGNSSDYDYSEFWTVASIEVYKIYPANDKLVECPNIGCNYYNIYDAGQAESEKHSSYISICKRMRVYGITYDDCELGKLVVGMKL